MLERLYVHNFRCLENFEFRPGEASSVLLIGKNGVGKSTVREALAVFQAIGRGTSAVKELMRANDFTRGRADVPITLEVEVRLKGQQFLYKLAFDLPRGFRALRVLHESLGVDGDEVYTRNLAEISLQRNESKSTTFSMDWHLIALPVIQDRATGGRLQPFRDWLQRMVLLSPLPPLMVGETTADPQPLRETAANLVDWLATLLESHPGAYTTVMEQVQKVMPDVSLLRFEKLGRESRALMVNFQSGKVEDEQPFERLSDGEKCFFLSAVLVAASRWEGPLFAFWDEPDNFVAAHEISSFVVDLKRSFARNGGQWIVSSHSEQTVLNFAVDSTWVMARASHLEPVRLRCADELDLSKRDVVRRLLHGDIDVWP